MTEQQAAKDRYLRIPIVAYDIDEDDTIIAFTTRFTNRRNPITLVNMGDEQLDTIPATESTTVIKSSLRTCPQSQVVVNSDDDNSSSDDDSLDCEGYRFMSEIDSLRDNPTPSSEVVIKSSSTSPNLFLEEINTFDNSSPEAETFCFDLEEISSGSPTTRSDLSLPDYKAFYVDNDHFKEKSSGSTITHVDFSQYDSFIFDLSNDQFPPPDRSDLSHRGSRR
ncbi:hypothetical protein Tco_0919251 [Tanacetum coccineum]